MSPEIVAPLIEAALREADGRLLVIGICGAQGSGKSTLAQALIQRFGNSAVLSLDDIYYTRAERDALARAVHPLFQTRGVPGTHDIALGLSVLDALDRGEAVALPRFDKSRDDRVPAAQWPKVGPALRLLVLEGWCVGARPEPEQALDVPVNALERDEDVDGCWRRHANAALAGNYQQLFARLDRLILLAAPGFAVVSDWRIQQERGLRAQSDVGAPGLMTDDDVHRFIQFYERLTRHILAEMPERADLVVRLRDDRSVKA